MVIHMSFKNVNLSFLKVNAKYSQADIVLLSTPMDATTSFRPGTRFAGNAIRVDSIGLEHYSPYQDKHIAHDKIIDIGDLDLPVGDVEAALEMIYQTTRQIVKDKKVPLMIGGEHLVTYPSIKAIYEAYPDVHIIHFDAHTDLRDTFLGRSLSHATVLRRCHEVVGDNRIFQFGIRSGEKEEFVWAKSGHTYLHPFNLDTLDTICQQLQDKPVYITIDLDVLDPSVLPGTGTPEPGGIQYKELLDAIKTLTQLNHIVGADVVELAPLLDPTGASTAAAAKTIREMLCLLQK